MLRVKEEAYPELIGSVDALEINALFARSVLTGDVDGEVYANRAEQPDAWYIAHAYGMSLIMGNSGDMQFQSDLREHYRRIEKDAWLQASPAPWVPFLRSLVQARLAEEYARLNFAFDADAFRAKNSDLEKAGFDVRRTPTEWIARQEGSVVAKAFWKRGRYADCVAYTAYADGEPASTAFTAYRHGNLLELGIETSEAHRGKGYAKASCAALIRYCLERDLVPCWSCRLENTGSVRLAGRLGFQETKRIPYFRILRAVTP